MKFMLTFNILPDKTSRNEAIARFMKTGGQPPQGVKLLGRWTRTDFSGGYFVLESENAGALTELALQWSDLMEVQLAPVVDDKEVTEVLKRTGF
jgi:hypothetical protein